jgi:hypothetical protein
MKYTLLTMFSVNLLLKLVISSSAATMWSLIHVLQVFRYILMININMPLIMQILMQYLAVVVGEVDEIESLVPDIFNTYIIDGDSLKSDATLYPKFEENGKMLYLFYRLRISLSNYPIWKGNAIGTCLIDSQCSCNLDWNVFVQKYKNNTQKTKRHVEQPLFQHSPQNSDRAVHRNISGFIFEHSQRKRKFKIFR